MKLERIMQYAVDRAKVSDGRQAEIFREVANIIGMLVRRPMETAPRDGSEIILITRTGVVSAHYDKGAGWSDDPINGKDYEGPSWVCYDDAFQLEIEETPGGERCPEAVAWLPMPRTE